MLEHMPPFAKLINTPVHQHRPAAWATRLLPPRDKTPFLMIRSTTYPESEYNQGHCKRNGYASQTRLRAELPAQSPNTQCSLLEKRTRSPHDCIDAFQYERTYSHQCQHHRHLERECPDAPRCYSVLIHLPFSSISQGSFSRCALLFHGFAKTVRNP
mgnify:CR=1 FL=1